MDGSALTTATTTSAQSPTFAEIREAMEKVRSPRSAKWTHPIDCLVCGPTGHVSLLEHCKAEPGTAIDALFCIPVHSFGTDEEAEAVFRDLLHNKKKNPLLILGTV